MISARRTLSGSESAISPADRIGDVGDDVGLSPRGTVRSELHWSWKPVLLDHAVDVARAKRHELHDLGYAEEGVDVI